MEEFLAHSGVVTCYTDYLTTKKAFHVVGSKLFNLEINKPTTMTTIGNTGRFRIVVSVVTVVGINSIIQYI